VANYALSHNYALLRYSKVNKDKCSMTQQIDQMHHISEPSCLWMSMRCTCNYAATLLKGIFKKYDHENFCEEWIVHTSEIGNM
jgi:hypothetical protein